MFSFFKKNKKEDSEPMTKDEEQIAKAKEDISEKGKDSQSAKDLVDESEGAKKADEKKDEGKEQGRDDKAEDDKEYVSKSDFEKMAARVEDIFTQMQNMGKSPERVDDERAKRLDRVAGIYND